MKNKAVAQKKMLDMFLGHYVLVRCRDAGVHAGTLVAAEGCGCVLRDSRRLWRWVPAHTKWLSGVAVHGLAEGSRIGVTQPLIALTENCEIAVCTAKAASSIRDYPAEEMDNSNNNN